MKFRQNNQKCMHRIKRVIENCRLKRKTSSLIKSKAKKIENVDDYITFGKSAINSLYDDPARDMKYEKDVNLAQRIVDITKSRQESHCYLDLLASSDIKCYSLDRFGTVVVPQSKDCSFCTLANGECPAVASGCSNESYFTFIQTMSDKSEISDKKISCATELYPMVLPLLAKGLTGFVDVSNKDRMARVAASFMIDFCEKYIGATYVLHHLFGCTKAYGNNDIRLAFDMSAGSAETIILSDHLILEVEGYMHLCNATLSAIKTAQPCIETTYKSSVAGVKSTRIKVPLKEWNNKPFTLKCMDKPYIKDERFRALESKIAAGYLLLWQKSRAMALTL